MFDTRLIFYFGNDPLERVYIYASHSQDVTILGHIIKMSSQCATFNFSSMYIIQLNLSQVTTFSSVVTGHVR